jgi:hypothetical protein
MKLSGFAILSILILLPVVGSGQTVPDKESQLTEQQKQKLAADALAAEQRTFAVSQLISLADEARSYSDLALRPRVLARVADTIWDADSDTARRIFRRAWEAAEAADSEELSKKIEDRELQMVAALRRAGGMDTRNEVLRTAARRDRALGEEFLAKLKDQTKEDSGSRNSSGNNSEDLDRRLRLARSLLDDNQVDQALAFAAPALNQVTRASISFLCVLRTKRADTADQRFVSMLALAELDPTSDANTVSLLSSYAFTPGYYITFSPSGNTTWSFGDDPTTPPDLPPVIRTAFFKVAANILLRPLPPPDQDSTSSGRRGKFLVINRLLPLFDQYAPDSAAALRSQLTALKTETGNRMPDPSQMGPSMNEGLKAKSSAGDILQRMQERLDHAKTSKERDAIFQDAASELADQGDLRAKDVADRIDATEMRNKTRAYVDFQLVRFAFKEKDPTEGVRLAKAGQLTHAERVWAYTQAARLLSKAKRSSVVDLLEEAIVEAERIEASDPDRASALFAVATQFVAIDSARVWEIIGAAVKAANGAEKFTGENVSIHNFPVALKTGGTFESTSEEDFGITKVLRLLAKDNLYRCMDVAKSFKKDRPRAVAIIAIAGATLEKSSARNREP